MKIAANHHEEGLCTQPMTEAVKDEAFTHEVSRAWCAIFNAQGEGEWNEGWKTDQAHEKLFIVPADDFDRSIITTWRNHGEIAGLSIIFIERIDRVMVVRELPPGHQSPKVLAAVLRNLEWVAGPDAIVIQHREFGIRPEYRAGLEPVCRLISDADRAAVARGADYGIYWSSKHARLYPLTAGLDVHPIFDFRDGTILVGDHIHAVLRRLATPTPQLAAMIGERRLHVKLWT